MQLLWVLEVWKINSTRENEGRFHGMMMLLLKVWIGFGYMEIAKKEFETKQRTDSWLLLEMALEPESLIYKC